MYSVPLCGGTSPKNSSKMKVAILTYPIHSNFGFLMQAYALQTFIKKLGHEPFTFYITPSKKKMINKIKQTVKDILYTMRGAEGYRAFRYWATKEQQEFMDSKTWDFVRNNIHLTSKIEDLSALYKFDINEYDAFIVGSDQVWRYAFLNRITTFYFDFLPDTKRRMSYAASFGISYLDYTKKDKATCKKLLEKFDILTVRESDGVKICTNDFGIDAIKVLDPVFLLDKNEYSGLAALGDFPIKGEFLFTYILDPNAEKNAFVLKIANERRLKIVNLLPEKFHLKGPSHIDTLVYPSVYDFLGAFKEADYVVTDSFHGTAFSIIFNKQFTVYSNKIRGNSRLISILQTFGIENRIFSDQHHYSDVINYKRINHIISEQRSISSSILKEFLDEVD